MCLAPLLAAWLLSPGCAGRRIRQAEDLRQEHRYEQALQQYMKELRAHPDKLFIKFEIDKLLREGAEHFAVLGAAEAAKGGASQAVAYYRKALEFDPNNLRVRQALARLQRPAESPAAAPREESAPPPELPAAFSDATPLDIEFRSGISLMELFRIIGRSAQLNILFDPGFKDLRVVISLKQMSASAALERLCQMYECRYYVLDKDNLLIASDTPATRERYQDRALKALHFSNIDAEEAKQVIDSTFKPARVITDKQGNSLIVIDSVENMAIVERIAQFIDRRRGEVEIEAEILEFDSKKLHEFGSELSSWSVGASLVDSDKGISPDALKGVDLSADLRLSLPSVLWKFLSQVTDSKILARPRVRGLDKERIEIQLGEKRPIVNTTFVPVAQGGVNQQAITSYSMTDVGILLNITPTVHHNDEVTLELEFVLTYVIDIGDTYTPPTLGNRRVTTKLRLRSGETGIIAGLMRGSTTSSRSGVPILGQIPVLREIFSSNKRVNERTDILLSITPRILQMPDLAPGDADSWQIGTGAKPRLQPPPSAGGEPAPKAQKKAREAGAGKTKKRDKQAPKKEGADAQPETQTNG